MRIKTFYTKTMSEAFREIKIHMGPEALLLSTKEVPRRSGVWGRSSGFEVVAAIDYEEDIDVFAPSTDHRAEIERANAPELPSGEMRPDDVVSETYSLTEIAQGNPASPKNMHSAEIQSDACDNPSVSEPGNELLPFKGRVPVCLYRDLVDCGVDAVLARTLLLNAVGLLSARQRRKLPSLLRATTQAAWSLIAAPSTQNEMPGKKVVAFVGPTGVGKTTSIAKLAARLALQKKKRVLLVTLDGYRIGGVEQLRSYAGLMGIPFRFVDQPSGLSRVIEENNQRDYILVDTAGRSPKDMESMHSLASFLRQSEFIERHLVLSATTKSADMRRIMDQFESCCPDHLLFTKLDETSTPGPILNELVRSQKAFSYYSDGQRIPDDLHAVPKERIIDLILNRNENASEE
jgi:flagellar biosynthesis protein FlhF